MANRYSSIGRDQIEYAMVLIFDAQGGCRMTRGQSALSAGERAMAFTVTLPTSLFKTPSLHATVTIADQGQSAPVIDVHAAQEALRGAIGCDVEVRICDPS